MNSDKLGKLASSERHEASTDQIEIRGQDGGKMGKVTRFAFMPNEKFKELTLSEQNGVLSEVLVDKFWKHCEDIRWWPDQRWPGKKEYTIEKQEDGSYVLISYLFKGIRNARSEHSIDSIAGIVSVNDK